MIVNFENANIEYLDNVANIMFNKSTNAKVTDICKKICFKEETDLDTELMTEFVAVAVEVNIPEQIVAKIIALFENTNPDFKR